MPSSTGGIGTRYYHASRKDSQIQGVPSSLTGLPLEREEEIVKIVKDSFAESVKEAHVARRSRVEVSVGPEKILEIASFLRDTLGLDYPNGVSAVDYNRESRFEIVYHLLSLRNKAKRDILVNLKESVARNIAKVPSLVSIWPGVENYERECFEMFGIQFDGHPRLEKLFLTDNWEGPPPMRKEIRFPTD